MARLDARRIRQRPMPRLESLFFTADYRPGEKDTVLITLDDGSHIVIRGEKLTVETSET